MSAAAVHAFANPYLDAFKKALDGGLAHFARREALVTDYAWAIPTEEAIRALVAAAPRWIEIGSGTGYWASLMEQCGADVFCYDKAPPDSGKNYYRHSIAYHPIETGGPEVLRGRAHSDRALLLCWPPFSDPMAEDCLRHWRGDIMAFVGEGNGGCTATTKFFSILKKQFVEVERHELPQWYGIHDDLTIYRRKSRR